MASASEVAGVSFSSFYQLYADHQTQAADVSYEWVVLLQSAEFGHGVVAGFGGAGWEIFFLHEIDVGEGGGAGDGIVTEVRELDSWVEGGGAFGAGVDG